MHPTQIVYFKPYFSEKLFLGNLSPRGAASKQTAPFTHPQCGKIEGYEKDKRKPRPIPDR